MPDELGIGLGAALGAKLIYDVCGPTAKYLGGKLASYTEAGVQNLQRVFEHAAEKIDFLGKHDGQVPPRVLKDIISEGYFCEDELQSVYLGGVLASSKGPVARDDRAVTYCSLISSLSSYQIRTHCILYTALLRSKQEKFSAILRWLYTHGVTLCILESDYQKAMEFSEVEPSGIIAEHVFVGLESRGLSRGGLNVIRSRDPKNVDPPFRYIHPTTQGVELFLWGQGIGDRGLNGYTPEALTQILLPLEVEPYDVKLGEVSFA